MRKLKRLSAEQEAEFRELFLSNKHTSVEIFNKLGLTDSRGQAYARGDWNSRDRARIRTRELSKKLGLPTRQPGWNKKSSEEKVQNMKTRRVLEMPALIDNARKRLEQLQTEYNQLKEQGY